MPPDLRSLSFPGREFTRVWKEWPKSGFGWFSTALGQAACDRFVHIKFFDDTCSYLDRSVADRTLKGTPFL